MNKQDQIKALAELDGLSWCSSQEDCWRNDSQPVSGLPNYNSRDVVIPLIEKQPGNVQSAFVCNILAITEGQFATDMLFATPQQLCEALLRATGKWIE